MHYRMRLATEGVRRGRWEGAHCARLSSDSDVDLLGGQFYAGTGYVLYSSDIHWSGVPFSLNESSPHLGFRRSIGHGLALDGSITEHLYSNAKRLASSDAHMRRDGMELSLCGRGAGTSSPQFCLSYDFGRREFCMEGKALLRRSLNAYGLSAEAGASLGYDRAEYPFGMRNFSSPSGSSAKAYVFWEMGADLIQQQGAHAAFRSGIHYSGNGAGMGHWANCAFAGHRHVLQLAMALEFDF
jgi:hypothetical protein